MPAQVNFVMPPGLGATHVLMDISFAKAMESGKGPYSRRIRDAMETDFDPDRFKVLWQRLNAAPSVQLNAPMVEFKERLHRIDIISDKHVFGAMRALGYPFMTVAVPKEMAVKLRKISHP